MKACAPHVQLPPFLPRAGGCPARLAEPAERVPAVSSAAGDQQIHPAVVRGQSGGVDDMHGVFPGAAFCRLCLRACADTAAPARAGGAALGASAGGRSVPADLPGRGVEAGGRRGSVGADFAAAGGDGGAAVFRAQQHQPAGAGVVHARGAGRAAVAALCALEHRLAGGAADISVRHRAAHGGHDADAGVVGGVCVFRGAFPLAGVEERARPRVRACPGGGDRRGGDTGKPGAEAGARALELGGTAPALGAAARAGQRAAAGGDEPCLPGCGGGALHVGGAAEPLPADLHHLLRA